MAICSLELLDPLLADKLQAGPRLSTRAVNVSFHHLIIWRSER